LLALKFFPAHLDSILNSFVCCFLLAQFFVLVIALTRPHLQLLLVHSLQIDEVLLQVVKLARYFDFVPGRPLDLSVLVLEARLFFLHFTEDGLRSSVDVQFALTREAD